MSFNSYSIKNVKSGNYRSPYPEFYVAYGTPSGTIPDYGKGCQFHTPDGFCNANPDGAYCEHHSRICGAKYYKRRRG